jgi:hypothetical protein
MGNCIKPDGGGGTAAPPAEGTQDSNNKANGNHNSNNKGTVHSPPAYKTGASKLTNNTTKSDLTLHARPKPSHLSNHSNTTSVHGGILREQTVDVYKKYEEVEVLGNGSMGHVAKVRVREEEVGGSAYRSSHSNLDRSHDESDSERTGSERRKFHVDYALKSIQLERVTPSFVDELKNEIDILNSMDHPNIIRLHEVYYHRRQIYLILELCDGGDLYTRLPYSEKDAAYIMGKLLSAVTYMHQHGIVHRDCE